MSLQRIKLRRGTTAEWAGANPVLASGEPGWDAELRVLKVGDGADAWAALPGIAIGSVGPAGFNAAFQYSQLTPLATWTIAVPVGFNRLPAVLVYLASGELVITDVISSLSSVTITFAAPVAGTAILT